MLVWDGFEGFVIYPLINRPGTHGMLGFGAYLLFVLVNSS